MKIESVRIENYRSFKDETIFFDDYTCFVGPNGVGKSTVLNALNVFFKQSKDCKTDFNRLSEEDYHHKNTKEPIKITITFKDLSDDAKIDFKSYVRLDKLIVSSEAKFQKELGCGEVKQYGSRLGINDFKKFFIAEKSGEKVAKLKEIYLEFSKKYSDLPKPGAKAAMIESLHDFESKNPDICDLIPSEDQFYGFSKGSNLLSKYVQWVFVSASKDYTQESEESKNSALGQLLARTVRSKVNFSEKIKEIKDKLKSEYENLLKSEQSTLDGISQSLGKRLESWSNPGISAKIEWKSDSEKSVKVDEPWAYVKLSERGFQGELARFGHGLQRSYILALLQELSMISDDDSPTLIMGIEEPEIYQHPPQARYLSELLMDLSEKASQIMVCTHSSLFIPGNNFEAVRIVRDMGNPPQSYMSNLKYSDLSELLKEADQKALKEMGVLAKLYPSLNPVTNEMFFCKKLILTEGIEDVAYVMTYLILSGKIVEFRKYGCHIVPFGGKSEIIKPLAMAKLLNIPFYVVCDADTNKDEIKDVKKRDDQVRLHKRDNKQILNICGYENELEWPKLNDLFLDKITMWSTNLTKTVLDEMGDDWKNEKSKSEEYYGQPGNLTKNPLLIARTLEKLWEFDKKSKKLISLVDSIVKFAKE